MILFQGPTNSTSASTGAAIFGSSPVPSHPIMPSTLGNASDRTISTPSPVTKISGAQLSEDQFKQSNNSDWTAMWPQESNNGMTTSSKNNLTAENNFASAFAPSNKNMNSAFSSTSNKSPINPFTGIVSAHQLFLLYNLMKRNYKYTSFIGKF